MYSSSLPTVTTQRHSHNIGMPQWRNRFRTKPAFPCLDSDRLRPGRGSGRSAVVGNPYAERVLDAIGGQLVLARALEGEELAVEGPVVGVPENRAEPVA